RALPRAAVTAGCGRADRSFRRKGTVQVVSGRHTHRTDLASSLRSPGRSIVWRAHPGPVNRYRPKHSQLSGRTERWPTRHPVLPDELRRLAFRLRYRQHSLSVGITQDALTVASDACGAEAISIAVDARHVVLNPGDRTTVPLARRL